jgi:hypothetical protein
MDTPNWGPEEYQAPLVQGSCDFGSTASPGGWLIRMGLRSKHGKFDNV